MQDNGTLFVCGTPIGNLDDITFRLEKTLKKVDLIACEDTRRTGKLLKHLGIKGNMTSYHQHNEKTKATYLMNRLKQGQKLALVSNAGMPGISDPGFELINRAVAEGLEVVPVPGPTALISALVVSGLPMDSFVFEGFLPRSGRERTEALERIKREKRTTIVYESPYRLLTTLRDLEQVIPERQLMVVREITKVHEEKIAGTASSLLKKLADREIKGEIVLVIAGHQKKKLEPEGWEDLTIVEHVELFMKNGYTKKEAIKKVAKTRGISRRKVYKEAIVIEVRVNE